MTEESQITSRDWFRGAIRSRTVWINMALAVLGGLELSGAHLTTLFGAEVAAGILLIGSLANLILRAITTTPLPHR
jgi:hypothetical protein